MAEAGAELWWLRLVLVAGLAVGSFPFWLVRKNTVQYDRNSSFHMAVFVAIVMAIAGLVSLIFPGQWIGPFYLLWLLVLAVPTGVTVVMWIIGRFLERAFDRRLRGSVERVMSEYVPGGNAFWVYQLFFIWSIPLLVDSLVGRHSPLGQWTNDLTSREAYDSWPVHAAAWSVWLYPLSVLWSVDSDAYCRSEPPRGISLVLTAFACTVLSVWSLGWEWGSMNPLLWAAIVIPAGLWLHVLHVSRQYRMKSSPDADDDIKQLLAKARGKGGGMGRELQALQILDRKGYRFPPLLLRECLLSKQRELVDWAIMCIGRDHTLSDDELRQLLTEGELIPEGVIGLARVLRDHELLTRYLSEPKMFWEAAKSLLVPPIMSPDELDALTRDAIPTAMCTGNSLSAPMPGKAVPKLLRVAVDKGDREMLTGILTSHGDNLDLLPLFVARIQARTGSDSLRASVLRAAANMKTLLAKALLVEGVLRVIPCQPKCTKRIPFPAVAPYAMEFLVELLAALNSQERRTRRVAVKAFVAASRLTGAGNLKQSLEAAKAGHSAEAQSRLDEILSRWGDTRIPCVLSERTSSRRHSDGWDW